MSQFIEMFEFHDLNLNSPSKDFDAMCFDDTSSATKVPAGDYLKDGKFAIYDQAQEKEIAGYSNDETGLCRNYPAVLFGDHSRVIKFINEPFFIGADGVKIIRPKKDSLLPEFLYYDLKYHNIPNTGYNRHFKYIKMISLTKASIEEQRKFLSIAHQADKSEFDGFKSQFIEMFGGAIPSVQIKDICSVVSGKSIPTKLEDIQGTVPYVKVADFNLQGNEKYIVSSQRYVATESAEFSKMIPAGSVVFAKNGAASLSNKKRLTKIECCIDMNTMAIIPKSNEILPEFLFAIVQAMDISAHVRQGAIPSISPKSIEESFVVLPSEEKQSHYIQIVQQADKSEYNEYYSIAKPIASC